MTTTAKIAAIISVAIEIILFTIDIIVFFKKLFINTIDQLIFLTDIT
jgi:hypothetical protein